MVHFHGPHASPYVEMLVPRRKGQLVKLLILVPLSLLLITSIYYQFCYEQPAIQLQPISAMLVNNNNYPSAHNQRMVNNSDRDEDQTSELQQLNSLDSNTNNNDILPGDSRRDRPDGGTKVEEKTYSYRHLRVRKPVPSQSSSSSASSSSSIQQDHTFTHQHKPESRDRQVYSVLNYYGDDVKKSTAFIEDLQTVKGKSFNLDETNDVGPAVDHNPLAHNAKPNQMRLSFASISPSRKAAIERLNADSVDLRPNVVKSDDAHGESELLREEEADAQDAAVIPAPSEPNGPGELGRPVVLKNLTKEQQDMVNVGWENNAFNQFVSDIISVNRSLPDVRDPSCKNLKYPNVSKLPPTSVIVCFHNEAWSVLLRTVHSIVNRSPRHLVKEIILVDDFSTKDHLKQQLEDYVRPLKIVKVVRAAKREGLIRARLLGAKASTAPVLTFLDSHCECAEGWLEPLLTRIYQDSRAVVCPVIDVISDKTFEYHYKGDANAVSVGGFDWNLQFNWHSIPDREKKRRKHSYDPIRSPTMAGGLFSIDKAFFERLGTYDSGFDIWGGENLELSFKTWMCGGSLEILPCSHVGHVFRSRSPYKWRTGVNVLKRNSVRLAEVWMDDYKKYYYDRIGHELGDYGDISERLELRKELHCKPFSYFVKEIYPELFIPGEAVAYGEVRNEAQGSIKMCLDSAARKADFHKPLGVYPCHGAGGNQYWLLSRDGEIRRDEACVDYAGHDVVLFPCHGSGGNQMWFYEKDTRQIKHSTSGRCMELARDRIRIQMNDCDPANDAQKWTFQHYNASLATTH